MNMLDYQNIREDTSLTIGANGKSLLIDYRELEAFHGGDSWFGCTVGFRAMQVAAIAFEKTLPWSREDLYVVSGHPGPGVKDAIDLVTQCVSTKHFRLFDDSATKICSRNMKFEWWLSNEYMAVHIKLHNGIVPEGFYQLLDRLNTDDERANDRDRFSQYKTDLSCQLWLRPLDALFDVEILPTALNFGELSHA